MGGRLVPFAAVAILVGIAAPRLAAAQHRGVRFEITHVADTTFGFPRGAARWLQAGATGIAVDPRNRDVLVARFRVISVDTGFVTALITGQTTRVATEHIAIVNEPTRPWYRTPAFWAGTLVGLLAGWLAAGG